MPYVDPQTGHNPATNGTAPASWGDDVRNGLHYVASGHPRCRLRHSANFTHNSSGNFLSVTFDTEDYDIGGCHSTSSNNSRITVPSGEGGLWEFKAHAYTALTSGDILGRFLRNGATAFAETKNTATATGAYLEVTDELVLVAGDYVEFQVYQASGGSAAFNGNDNRFPKFIGRWVATAT